MSGTRLLIYTMQLNDIARGQAVSASGGTAIVTLAGSPRKATLFNPDTGASLANPVTLTRGQIRFAVDSSVTSVDIYGFAPDGGFFTLAGVRAGTEAEISYRIDQNEYTAIIPFAAQDYTAATETTTGLQFRAGSLIQPDCCVRVTTAEGSRTIEVGLLSSESGGDLDGFIDALSLASAGTIAPALTSATPTLGALLVLSIATTPAVSLPRTHGITTTARTISITTSASTATAQGFVMLPFLKPPF